jgi:hypothetical protein
MNGFTGEIGLQLANRRIQELHDHAADERLARGMRERVRGSAAAPSMFLAFGRRVRLAAVGR